MANNYMLTRLTDRIEKDTDGNDIVIRRYGLWGTTAEIETNGKTVKLIYPDGKFEKYKLLKDAEIRLKELAAR